MQVTVVLGDEWDSALITRVCAALRALGAELVTNEWGVGGSQEVSIQTWRLGGECLVLEGETYMGFSVTGPEALVSSLVGALTGDS